MEQIETFFTAAIMIAFLISTLRSLRSRQKSLKNLEANAPKRHRRGAV
jgi:hypothetical protein